MKNVVMLSIGLCLLAGCSSGFTALPLSALSLSSQSSAPQTHDPVTAATLDCSDVRLVAAFSQSYWAFTKKNCAACHGAGVTGRAFASETLAEAFASFRDPSKGAFKDARIRANAVNPLHGAPTSNGPFQSASIEEAAKKWTSLASEICASKAPTSGSGNGTPVPVVDAEPPMTKESGSSIGIVNQLNIFSTYRALTGIEPSAETKKKIYDDPRIFIGIRASRRFLLPPSAKPSGYNSATLLIGLVATTEHCNDLVSAEERLAPGARKFFGAVDFARTSLDSLSSSQEDQVAGALAKGFWRREPSGEEHSAIKDAFADFRSQGMGTKQAMILVCSMALSSLSANVR